MLENAIIANQNTQIFKRGFYTIGKEVIKVEINEKDTQIIDKIKDQYIKSQYDTDILINSKDSITQAIELINKGSTLVLNFASYKNPGGGYLKGSPAQEESICRQTSLYPSLIANQEWYNKHKGKLNNGLYGDDMLLTKNVKIIRNIKGELIDVIGVITSAAVNRKVVHRFRQDLEYKVQGIMHQRMDKILTVAYQNKYKNIVLGAFGCGVFGNNVIEIATSFKELLDTKFKGAFKAVAFPIYKSNHNLLSFNKVFK